MKHIPHHPQTCLLFLLPLTPVWLPSAIVGASCLVQMLMAEAGWLLCRRMAVVVLDVIVPLFLGLESLLKLSSFWAYFGHVTWFPNYLCCHIAFQQSGLTWLCIQVPEDLRLAQVHFTVSTARTWFTFKVQGESQKFVWSFRKHRCLKTTKDHKWPLSVAHVFPGSALKTTTEVPGHKRHLTPAEWQQTQTCRQLSRHKSLTIHWWFANVG